MDPLNQAPARLSLDGLDGGLLLLGRGDVLRAGDLDIAGGEDDLDVSGVALVCDREVASETIVVENEQSLVYAQGLLSSTAGGAGRKGQRGGQRDHSGMKRTCDLVRVRTGQHPARARARRGGRLTVSTESAAVGFLRRFNQIVNLQSVSSRDQRATPHGSLLDDDVLDDELIGGCVRSGQRTQITSRSSIWRLTDVLGLGVGLGVLEEVEDEADRLLGPATWCNQTAQSIAPLHAKSGSSKDGPLVVPNCLA